MRWDFSATTGPPPLNTAMNKLSGPPDVTEFDAMLDDKDGKPQIDAVMISALLPYMFPLELRWKLVQFARRGGTLIVYGNSQFQSGEIPNSKGVIQFTYSMPPARFHGCFQQDLVYVPWGGTDVDTEKGRELMIKSGFNCVWTMSGSQPGWYSWSVAGQQFDCKPLWPGDLIERATWRPKDMPIAQEARRACWTPRFTTVHHWDETEIKFVEDERVKDLAPQASLCYRKWVKSCYLSLDKLNAAWRKSYRAGFQPDGRPYEEIRDEMKLWNCRSNAIPAARPWNGDLTSWNQIYAYRGAPEDWASYANSFWVVYDKEIRDEYRRYSRGNNPWIWFDTYHTRNYYAMKPGDAEWQAFEYRATTGNEPATIMPHFLYGKKTPESTRRIHWDAIRTGARHFIVYNADLGSGGDAANIWTADYELEPHGKWMADSIARVRSKEQVLLDTRTELSNKVAFLFARGDGWPPGWRTPRAPLTAMIFSGIQPDALKVGELRGERTPLDSFRVLVVCPSPDVLAELKKQRERDEAMAFDFSALQGAAAATGQSALPERWVNRLAEWQRKGGTLLSPIDLQLGWEGNGSGSDGFLEYRAKVKAKLAQAGVSPTFEIVDNAGKPVDLVEPTVLQTEDGTQSYVIVFPHVNAKAPAEFACRFRAPGVREVYSVYGEKLLPRGRPQTVAGDGWRMALRQSYGEIFSIVTEDLGPVELEPRLVAEQSDRRLDLKITVKRKDGTPSACRHSVNIRAFDDAGREIEGMFTKASVLGWRAVTLYPAHGDPPLPWTIKVLDLTSGREGEVKVAEPAAELFASREPPKPIEFRTEPLQPLGADIHLVPFRVTVVNNQDEPLSGSVKLDVPEKYLLDVGGRQPIGASLREAGAGGFSAAAFEPHDHVAGRAGAPAGHPDARAERADARKRRSLSADRDRAGRAARVADDEGRRHVRGVLHRLRGPPLGEGAAARDQPAARHGDGERAELPGSRD